MSTLLEQDTLYPLDAAKIAASWSRRHREVEHDLESAFPSVSVVTFAQCTEANCKVLEEEHLLVESLRVSRLNGSAAAISYTWGEFNRRKVTIGHNRAGDNVTLELGEEWDTNDLKVSLVKLSRKYGALWMDQLCIQQDTTARKKQGLQSIPYIFRTFDVVALMPGRPCACFTTKWKAIIDACNPLKTPAERDAAKRLREDLKIPCTNSSGVNSYFDRVWTFQEMLYSTTISVWWVGSSPSLCGTDLTEAGNLDKYALGLFNNEVAHGFSREEAFRAVKHANMEFNKAATIMMEYYCAYNTSSDTDAQLALARFFLGQPVHNLQPRSGGQDIYDKLRSFLFRLDRLGQGTRKSTKPRDLVLSVWVDCPGYDIPDDFDSLSSPALLENAVVQMERKLGVSLVVNFPAGVLGLHNSTALWRPTAYLDEVRDSSQLYGPLVRPTGYMRCKSGCIPLAGLGYIYPSLSARVTEYRQLFQGHTAAEVLPHLKKVVKGWPERVLIRVFEADGRQDKRGTAHRTQPEFLLRVFEILVLKDAVLGLALENDSLQTPPKDGTLNASITQHAGLDLSKARHIGIPDHLLPGTRHITPEVDHYSVMYRLVTYALGLDMQTCQKHNLKLVLSLDDPPCVGLMSSELYDARSTTSSKHSEESTTPKKPTLGKGRLATICAQRGPKPYGCVLYEAVCTQRNAESYWNIGGVWVPMSATPLHEVQFVVHVAARDGFMGPPNHTNMDTGSDTPPRDRTWSHEADDKVATKTDASTHNHEAVEKNPGVLPRWRTVLAVLIAVLLLLGTTTAHYGLTPAYLTRHPDSLKMCIPPPEWWRLKSRVHQHV